MIEVQFGHGDPIGFPSGPSIRHHTSHPKGADLDLTHLFGDAHPLPTVTVYGAVMARNMIGEVVRR